MKALKTILKTNFLNLSIILFFCSQIYFSILLKNNRSQFENTPYPPTKLAIKALSFGDEQFLFRYYVLQLQNAGDKIGFVTSIKNHNYARLYQWFIVLDDIDKNSKITPSLASNYYGSSADSESVKWVIKYLIENGLKNIESNWRSLTYAAYLAKNINDYNLIVKSTEALTKSNNSKIPLWAKTLGIFYLQNDIEDGKIQNLNQQQIICKSWELLSNLQQDILEKRVMEDQIQKDPIFSQIIYSRLQKVKQNSNYLKNCK